MARSINDIYNFCVYIIRKQRGGMLTISEFNQIMNTGQLDAVEAWFSLYGENQKIHDAIRKLRVYETFTSNSNGEVVFNADYLHMIGNPSTIYGSSPTVCKFVQEDEYSFLATSAGRPITNEYPVAVDNNTGFTIYPNEVQIGFYWYLRLPAVPVLAYTQSGRTITYDPNASTQLEFSDVYINNIIARALVYVGVNLNEQDIAGFATAYNQQTQP